MAEFDLEAIVGLVVVSAIVLWIIGKLIGKDPQPTDSKDGKRTDSEPGRRRLGEKVLCRDCGVKYHYPQFTRCLDCNQAKLADSKSSRRRSAATTKANPRTVKPGPARTAATRLQKRRHDVSFRRPAPIPKALKPSTSKSVTPTGDKGAKKKRRGPFYILNGRYSKQFLRELHHGFIGREWWK